MAIEYTIENTENYLKVVARGIDDNLSEVLGYSQAVVEAAIKHNSKKILCDEQNLIYNVSVIDTYELAEFASKYAHKLVKIAIVCNIDCIGDGKFYETVASNRGLKVRVTCNFEEAVKWLMTD